MDLIIKGYKKFKDLVINVPGDKSIAHRSLIIGSIPKGNYNIYNFPFSEDCLSTVQCMKELGVSVVLDENDLSVTSPGYKNFNDKVEVLNVNNSGTAARLLSGLLSGCNIETTLIGDNSLSNRPMKRIVEPLKLMGANICCKDEKLPLKFKKNNGLKGIKYELPVASAQVKSCILIGGYLAKGRTEVIENIPTRDHTENMFKYLGCHIERKENTISIENSSMDSKDIFVPGDPSSAAFLIGATLLGENSSIKIENVLLNKGRIKYIEILKKMGGKITVNNKGYINEEPVGDIIVYSSDLNGIIVESKDIPSIIDEIPMLSVVAAFSSGKTVFKEIEELKYKECNRVEAIINNLKSLGIEAYHNDNNIEILGLNDYIKKDAYINSYKDHRIALAFLIASMRNKGITTIGDYQCSNVSFPNSLMYFKNIINIINEL